MRNSGREEEAEGARGGDEGAEEEETEWTEGEIRGLKATVRRESCISSIRGAR